MARARLFLVSNPAVNSREDFEEVARFVTEAEPEVAVTVVEDAPTHGALTASEPALTVSPIPLRWFRPPRGPVLTGQSLAKSAEYAALEAAGLPVPPWTLLGPGLRPSVDGLGRYVVAKPDRGARSAEVRILRADKIRWRPPNSHLGNAFGGVLGRTLLQRFVYTGPWPASYRVGTCFGKALYAWRVEASRERKALVKAQGFFDFDGVSIASSGKGCTFALTADEEVLRLAERAHSAFPTLPLLGVDIVRERDTGGLYLLEVNSLGYVWHFSSPGADAMQREFGLDLDAQFDGRRRAARALGRETLARAR